MEIFIFFDLFDDHNAPISGSDDHIFRLSGEDADGAAEEVDNDAIDNQQNSQYADVEREAEIGQQPIAQHDIGQQNNAPHDECGRAFVVQTMWFYVIEFCHKLITI